MAAKTEDLGIAHSHENMHTGYLVDENMKAVEDQLLESLESSHSPCPTITVSSLRGNEFELLHRGGDNHCVSDLVATLEQRRPVGPEFEQLIMCGGRLLDDRGHLVGTQFSAVVRQKIMWNSMLWPPSLFYQHVDPPSWMASVWSK